MPPATSYAPGTPCWVDLATPDVQVVAPFYEALLGWSAEDQGAAFGHYHRFKQDGASAAGMMAGEHFPAAWTTYVGTEDADATVAAVREAGGQVVIEPMQLHDLGRMALCTDDEGAAFGLWEPGTFAGAEVVNEPGALTWNEVSRRDPEAAKAFYGAVFGWGADTSEQPGAGPYTTWRLGDAVVGGMLHIDERWPDMAPSWTTYFAIADVDAAVQRVPELGGVVHVAPLPTPFGRMAVLADPAGATFSTIELEPAAAP